jgi:hypothetical protein
MIGRTLNTAMATCMYSVYRPIYINIFRYKYIYISVVHYFTTQCEDRTCSFLSVHPFLAAILTMVSAIREQTGSFRVWPMKNNTSTTSQREKRQIAYLLRRRLNQKTRALLVCELIVVSDSTPVTLYYRTYVGREASLSRESMERWMGSDHDSVVTALD